MNLSCSTMYKSADYYKNSTYSQFVGHDRSQSVFFEFKDSTYTNIETGFYGHGKWKLSEDKKTIVLNGVIKIRSDEVIEFSTVEFKFKILERGNLLINEKFYLNRIK